MQPVIRFVHVDKHAHWIWGTAACASAHPLFLLGRVQVQARFVDELVMLTFDFDDVRSLGDDPEGPKAFGLYPTQRRLAT